MDKPLIIDVKENAQLNDGKKDNWTHLTIDQFVKDIKTPDLDKNVNIGTLVSGIPTAFARVDLLKTALSEYKKDPQQTDSALNSLSGFYAQLVDEWKGLIAAMALDYQHISARTVTLAYTDGQKAEKTSNIYEPKGAFGNMLLERRDLWSDPQDALSSPVINIIKYNNQVVGATSPETLLFTSSGYLIPEDEDKPWINRKSGRKGKFTDPLNGGVMSGDQLMALYAYVEHIINALPRFENYYAPLSPSLKVDYSSINAVLDDWIEEIKARAIEEKTELTKGTVPPVSAGFSQPFQGLFCHKDILYGVEGLISEKAESDAVIEFDPQELLLDETASIPEILINPSKEDGLKNFPLLVMQAKIKGKTDNRKRYFALPLTPKGLNVFGRNLKGLLGYQDDTSIKSELRAIYDEDARTGNLEVEFTIVTNEGKTRVLKKIYTVEGDLRNGDILLWPNFISTQWDKYYLYNEFPHNATTQTYRAVPMAGEMVHDSFRIIVDEKKDPILLAKGGAVTKEAKEKAAAELLITYNEKVAGNPYRYEIYKSSKPYIGINLVSPSGKDGGYLMVNYDASQGTKLPQDRMKIKSEPKEVTVGIDFGSTNTSIAYYYPGMPKEEEFKNFEFVNQRVSLFGHKDSSENPRENQIFFFQGFEKPVKFNAIKSVLTLHDPHRIAESITGIDRNTEEVTGGFPSFADNLPFFTSDNRKITLKFHNTIGEVTQIHNMKWEDSKEDKAHKEAYLRSLMLQIYAALFYNHGDTPGYVPTKLRWSYPSSMAESTLLDSYNQIWKQLSHLSPVTDKHGKKYPLIISRYINPGRGGDGDSDFSFGSEFADSGFDLNNGFSDSGFGGDFGGNNSGFGTGFGDSGTAFGNDFGNNDSGFGGDFGGNDSDFGSGFGNNDINKVTDSTRKVKRSKFDFMPEDNTGEIDYQPVSIFADPTETLSMSEAESVANFKTTSIKDRGKLTLVFDVGGSTTDISALVFLKSGITMIKQNSLRFAAQRVSQVVGHFPKFQDVLQRVCAQNGIKMVGLNVGLKDGRNNYNEKTAPYFFDQIINRLNNNQLIEFYREIAADTPMLMCVNLYVTGLLMFYAGQVANKLIENLNRSKEDEGWPKDPRSRAIEIHFAGKGSRLYQWFRAINPKAASEYYLEMFSRGYGIDNLKKSVSGWPKINLPELEDENIKYEVSKGLSRQNNDDDLKVPSTEQTKEIVGETGFALIGDDNKPRSIDFTNAINKYMMQEIGRRFVRDNATRNPAEKFTEFCVCFFKYANRFFGWRPNPEALQKACRDMNIIAYVQDMPEFRLAQESKDGFNFVAPIIIVEGMKFYEDTLLKLL